MVFAELSTNMQQVITFNFYQFGKVFLLLFPLFLALYYKYFVWEKKSSTPYLLVGMFRVAFYWLSTMYIFLSPLTFVLLHPEFDFFILLTFMIVGYLVVIVVMIPIIMLNILYFAPVLLLKKAGLDFQMQKDNKALNMIENQWGLKWKEE